jgi:hypothetical protein
MRGEDLAILPQHTAVVKSQDDHDPFIFKSQSRDKLNPTEVLTL